MPVKRQLWTTTNSVFYAVNPPNNKAYQKPRFLFHIQIAPEVTQALLRSMIFHIISISVNPRQAVKNADKSDTLEIICHLQQYQNIRILFISVVDIKNFLIIDFAPNVA